MSDHTAPSPQDDADRIRLKRLAKLQNAASASPTPSTSGTSTPLSQPLPQPPKPKPIPRPSVAATPPHEQPRPASGLTKKKPIVTKFDQAAWEHETLVHVLKVTLEHSVAERSEYNIIWLKYLAAELASEGVRTDRLTLDILDRLLISRLELNPEEMTDDLDYLPILVSLPPKQTVFEYLVGCWKRLNAARSAVIRKNYTPVDTQSAIDKVDSIRELIISYAGLILQSSDMFPQPTGRPLGPPELVNSLLSLSTLSAPLLGTNSGNPNTLGPTEIEQFLSDLVRRFEPDNELDDILGPVVAELLSHPSLSGTEGLGNIDASWRGVVAGLEVLVANKAIASMVTRMEQFNPVDATAPTFEKVSLLGPLCRLGIFSWDWPAISTSYFNDPQNRSRADIESSFASLRGTLKSLQSSLFQIFNALIRAGHESREAVLDYFSRVVSLNVKRAGMQVDPRTVASDSFMFNLQSILLRLAEPFMDATYSKASMDRIDPLYYCHSSRIDLTEETRIKATSEEANEFAEQNKLAEGASAPNFISNVFFLTVAMSHYGFLRTVQTYTNFPKHLEDIQRHLDHLTESLPGAPPHLRARTEAMILQLKTEEKKLKGDQLSYEAALLDPEMTFRSIGFTSFLSTWLIRQADPKKKHPSPAVELPLPKEVPMFFRTLPEYIVEDIVDHLYFAVQYSPDKFELSGRTELMTFVLTFLSSTWYIKNPFLKSKINDVLFMSIWGYARERNGILGSLLNSHSMALKHLMPALMHFYIEVEQTGASSQFYDKFNARRNIAYILKVVWDNPTHREALNIEAKNVDKFVRFVNLMINDVTYLMDESLSELTQIHNIQVEMDDKEAWEAKPQEYRRDKENALRGLERHASGYITLGRSTVELLKVFTAETKAPFMMPEIVDRLAAMLDYNLQAMAGPKYQELHVREPEKLKFRPKELLADILQVYLNLSDQAAFVKAVAGDGRSYSKELFDRAARIAERGIKSSTEIEQWREFTAKIEEAKATLEEEEDLGDIPDEYLDPVLCMLMRNPVLLPSSKVIVDISTIKSHLLSDTKDPFNRSPLSIEDVVPLPELKAQIEAWVIQRREERKKDAAGSAMDTSS